MSSILLPSRRIVLPQVPVGIDYANLFGRRCTYSSYPLSSKSRWNAKGVLETAEDAGLSLIYGATGKIQTVASQITAFNNADSNVYTKITAFYVLGNIQGSASWHGIVDNGRYSYLSIQRYSNTDYLYIFNRGEANGAATSTLTRSMFSGGMHVIGLTYASGTTKVYLDGVITDTLSVPATPTLDYGCTAYRYGRSWDNNAATRVDFGQRIVFGGAVLSDAEIKSLSDNINQVYVKHQRRIWFDMGAALDGGGTTYTDSFTESLTASDTHSQSAVFGNAISEGLTAADSYLHNAVFADTLSYGITADDALGHIQSILETLTESVTAGFTQSDSLTSGSGTTYNENITESLTAAYSVVDSATFVNALNEALTVSESLADNAVYSVLVNEALTAVSTFADSTPGATTLTAADLAAIDALIVARISDIAAAIGTRIIEGTLTQDEITRIQLAALAGKVAKSGTNITFKSVDGLTNRIDGTVDTEGNRTAVTLDGSA